MTTINTLLQVNYLDGSLGFVAKNEDTAPHALFDAEGQEIHTDPGPFVVVRVLGQYPAGDEDAFWSLVTRV